MESKILRLSLTSYPALIASAWRLARRELRGGLAGFRVFLACLAIGVGAIASVGSISAALVGGLSDSARDLLGGDVEFHLAQRVLPPETIDWLKQQGRVSEVRLMRAMARTPDDLSRTLVELKTVDSAYPLSGSVALEPGMMLEDALAVRNGVPGAVADRLVFERLHLAPGGRIKLGGAEIELRAALTREPDAATSLFSLGPRLMIATAALARTGLNQPGTLSSTAYRVLLPPGHDAQAFIAAADRQFPDAGWQSRDLAHASPGVDEFIERTAQFLSLVGLTSLLVGGVGVGNASASYLAARADVIATLKCLGASAGLIYLTYLFQIMVLASLGSLIGLVFGAISPWLVQAFVGADLPVQLRLAVYPAKLVQGAAFGLLIALGFSLVPLARARLVSAASLFRGSIVPRRMALGWRDRGAMLFVAALVVLLVLIGVQDHRLALWFVVASIVALGAFQAAGWVVMAAARRVGRPRLPWLRLALANLYRPGAMTPTIVLSLGLGLTVLVAVTSVEASLSGEVDARVSAGVPSFFFIDIQPDQIGPFETLVKAQPGASDLVKLPSLRARIATINGVPAAQAKIEPDQRRLVDSERGLTYAAEIPRGSTVVDGTWWPSDYQGPPLISIDRSLANGLHVKLGDTVGFDVAGREITGRIANLRQIDWGSLGINFFTVFAPGALDHAPQTVIATVRVDTEANEEALSKAVTDQFPNISTIRVREELERVRGLLADLSMVVRLTAVITIAAGILVLAGAVSAGQRRRLYDSAILKVLGATRPMIARGILLEYGALGVMTGLLATGFGALGSWLVVVLVMKSDWQFATGRVALTLAGCLIATLAVALAGSWRALSDSAVGQLRQD